MYFNTYWFVLYIARQVVGLRHMGDYNFWADLLDTFQSSPDWIKALWLLIPPGFLLALIAMLMHYRIAGKRADDTLDGELVYLLRRSVDGQLHIVSHAPQLDGNPAPMLLDPPRDQHRDAEWS